jgi:putative FmdB family regulatory protein
MAAYTYKCPLCSSQKDVSHSINEAPTYQCDNCKVDLIKVFSAPQVAFKGGGWGKDAR